MNGHYWGMGWGMWFIPLLIILIVYLLFKNNSQSKNQETSLGVLKRRYAKGEITKEEYEQMKSDLSK